MAGSVGKSENGLFGQILRPGFTDAGANTAFEPSSNHVSNEADVQSEAATEIRDNRSSTKDQFKANVAKSSNSPRHFKFVDPSITASSTLIPPSQLGNIEPRHSGFFPSTKPQMSPRSASPQPLFKDQGVTSSMVRRPSTCIEADNISSSTGDGEADQKTSNGNAPEKENQKRLFYLNGKDASAKKNVLNAENLRIVDESQSSHNPNMTNRQSSSQGNAKSKSSLLHGDSESDIGSTASEMGTMIDIGNQTNRMADVEAMAALIEASPNVDSLTPRPEVFPPAPSRTPNRRRSRDTDNISDLAMPALDDNSRTTVSLAPQMKVSTRYEMENNSIFRAMPETTTNSGSNTKTSKILSIALKKFGTGLNKTKASLSAPPTPNSPSEPSTPRLEDLLRSISTPKRSSGDDSFENATLPASLALRSPGSSARVSLRLQRRDTTHTETVADLIMPALDNKSRPNVSLSRSTRETDPTLDYAPSQKVMPSTVDAIPNNSKPAEILSSALRRLGTGFNKTKASLSAPPTPKSPPEPSTPRLDDLLKSISSPRSNSIDMTHQSEELPASLALRSPGSSARLSLRQRPKATTYSGARPTMNKTQEKDSTYSESPAQKEDIELLVAALAQANDTIRHLHEKLQISLPHDITEEAPVVHVPIGVRKDVPSRERSSISENKQTLNTDAENFVTDWDRLTTPLPPPPDHGLHSPIVNAVLEQWTEDRSMHGSLLNWMERVMTGDNLEETVPPLTISSLDHQVRDGFMMHVLPLLLRRADIHLSVETRSHRSTKYDIAVSVNQNREFSAGTGDTLHSPSLLDTQMSKADEAGNAFNEFNDANDAASDYNAASEDAEDSVPQSTFIGALGGALGGLLSRGKYAPIESPDSGTRASIGLSLHQKILRSSSYPQQRQSSMQPRNAELDNQPYHRVVSAPPGRIGITFVEYRGHAMVADMAPDSPLSSWVFPSDILIAVDELPVSGMRVRDIIKILTDRKDQQRALRVISSHAMNEFTLNQSILSDETP